MATFYVDDSVSPEDEVSEVIANPGKCDLQELDLKEDHFSSYENINVEDIPEQHQGRTESASKSEWQPKPSKLRRGFDAVVAKAYSGMSHLGLVPKDQQSGSAEHDYFHTTCKAISKHLMELTKFKHGDDAVFPKLYLSQLKKTMEILHEKEILISFFGQQNCGKSTLLNALLGYTFLPVLRTSETSVEVKIQHDSSVHSEVCLGPSKCKIPVSAERKSSRCPTLYVTKLHRKEPKTYIGPEDIRRKLEKVNKKVRDQKKEPPLSLVLKVNIPVLDGNIPQGWSVSLVDNPGFGEANKHIEQMAAVSMKSSAAYIYLMETERMDSQKDKESLQAIAMRDDSAFIDGRLVIGITKFDANYEDMHEQDHEMIAVTEDSCRDKVQAIMDAIRSENPSKMVDFGRMIVIPLSGIWARNSKELEMSLEYDPADKKEKNLKKATKALKYDPKLHEYLVCGQGEKHKKAIQRMNPKEVVQRLNVASGITKLTEKIHHMVDKVCVKMWATKLSSEFAQYLKIALMGLTQRRADLQDQVQKKKEDIDESTPLYKSVQQKKSEILDTTVKVSDRVHHKKQVENGATGITGTPLTPHSQQKQQEENDGAERPIDGHIPDLWEELNDKYHKDLQDSDPQTMGKEHSKGLCAKFKDKCETKIADRECKFGPKQFESDIMDFLETSAKTLEKLFDLLCGFPRLQETVKKHTENMYGKCSDLRLLAQKINNKVNVEIAKMPKPGRPRSETKVNLGDIRTRVSIPPVKLTFWEKLSSFFRNVGRYIKKRVTSQTSESSDTLDSDLDDFQYREWTTEMDEITGRVLAEMEEVCDKYFVEIKEKTIKYFFDEYSTKTKQQLERFDHEFGATLRAERIRLDKLNEQIKKRSKEIGELESMLKLTRDYKKQLTVAYGEGFGQSNGY